MKRILLIVPEPVLAEVTSFRLELHGYTVETVNSAEEALPKALEEEPFDMILMDLSLPGMGGHGLLEKLSANEATCNVPVIVLSIDADLDQVEKVVELGAVDFLLVPFDPEALVDKVSKLAAQVDAENKQKKREAVKK